jgi:hypothetical protein
MTGDRALWVETSADRTQAAALYLEADGRLTIAVNDGGDVGEMRLTRDQARSLTTALMLELN